MNNNVTFINLEYFFNKILQIFQFIFRGGDSPSLKPGFFQFLLFGLSVFFLIVIVYCAIRMIEIRRKEHHHLTEEIAEYAHHQAMREQEKIAKGATFKNEKWDMVLEHLFTSNEGDWKLAILEADTMLEELMDQMGFLGENLGERLKLAREKNFKSIQTAWEAHIIRNKIAHEGPEFKLSQQEAKRVIALYESIFRENNFI